MTMKIIEGQDPLPFRSGERRGVLAYALPWERRYMTALGVLFVLFMALYVYFVMVSVVDVAARQDLLSKVASTKTAVSQLETAYLAKAQNVSEEYAHSIGYVTVAHEAFVERSTAVSFANQH